MKHNKRGIERRASNQNHSFPLHLPNGQSIEKERRSNKHRRQNDFISEQSFFDEVPYDLIEPLITLCTTLVLEAGDILLKPQQPNRNLYLVLKGQLKVHIDKVDSQEGFMIQPGEFLGELSVIDGQLPSAFVVAEQPSHVLSIPDEILWNNFFKNGTIARNFMSMFAKRLRDRNEHIQRALEQELRLEHLQKELSIAHDIQASMLPTVSDKCSKFPQVDLEASMTPANEVGGDFYDLFPVDKENICLSIGDVSGKGIPASLFMVKTLTLLREEIMRQEDLSTAITNTNLKLCQDNDSCMFATVIIGILNVKSGIFNYINAGHNLPLLVEGGNNSKYLKSDKGILLGINENAEYTSSQLQLAKDDVLVLYTDGITEAMNNQYEIYTDERFQKLLTNQKNLTAASTVEEIITGVKQFTGSAPQSDDLTLLVLRYCK